MISARTGQEATSYTAQMPVTAAQSHIGVTSDPLKSMARVGLWTQELDLQPAARAREVAAELEDLGYPAAWISEGVRREVFTNSAPVRIMCPYRSCRHNRRIYHSTSGATGNIVH
jgi:hypothetical protein